MDNDISYFSENPKHNMTRDWKNCKITTKFTYWKKVSINKLRV